MFKIVNEDGITATRVLEGTDPLEIVTRAAWCSYGNEDREYTEDQGWKLARYLWDHDHWTPWAQIGWVAPTFEFHDIVDSLEWLLGHPGFEWTPQQGLYGSAWAWSSTHWNGLGPRAVIEFARKSAQPTGDHERIHILFELPIFVARQVMRSNVGIVWNEMSGRYIELNKAFLPSQWRNKPAPGQSKQGSTGSNEWANGVDFAGEKNTELFENLVDDAFFTYQLAIKNGVAPEQSRMLLSLNTMTRVVGCASRKRWQEFAALRTTPDVQSETRLIGEQVREIAA